MVNTPMSEESIIEFEKALERFEESIKKVKERAQMIEQWHKADLKKDATEVINILTYKAKVGGPYYTEHYWEWDAACHITNRNSPSLADIMKYIDYEMPNVEVEWESSWEYSDFSIQLKDPKQLEDAMVTLNWNSGSIEFDVQREISEIKKEIEEIIEGDNEAHIDYIYQMTSERVDPIYSLPHDWDDGLEEWIKESWKDLEIDNFYFQVGPGPDDYYYLAVIDHDPDAGLQLRPEIIEELDNGQPSHPTKHYMKWKNLHTNEIIVNAYEPRDIISIDGAPIVSGNWYPLINERRVVGDRYRPYTGTCEWVQRANERLISIANDNFRKKNKGYL